MTAKQSTCLSISLLIATVVCAILALAPLPRGKARAQRYNGVNTVAGSSLKLPAINLPTTNAPAAK